jgi:hypothetical protein
MNLKDKINEAKVAVQQAEANLLKSKQEHQRILMFEEELIKLRQAYINATQAFHDTREGAVLSSLNSAMGGVLTYGTDEEIIYVLKNLFAGHMKPIPSVSRKSDEV